MGEQEKEMLKQLGDGNRIDCLARLAEQLQTTEDRDRQDNILTAITKVCSFETDTMFRAYIEDLRKEDEDGTSDEV